MSLKRRDFLKRFSAGVAGIAAFFRLEKFGVAAARSGPRAQRLVLIKIDGLPHRLVDEFANETDPETGKSRLPWVKHVFYERGTRLANFYVRGMSLSAPSWSLLDTGQHLQIKGNVEFDRLTLHAYDYLNFIPFYVENLAQKHVDMPGAEVLDELGVPLLIDAYPHDERYQCFQLYQRGVHWSTFGKSVKTRLERFGGTQDVIDEWSSNGVALRHIIPEQLERDLIEKLADSRIRYLDYYTTDVDHRTHHNRDRESQLAAIRGVDASIGRIWTTVQKSPLAKDTVVVLVSDHGTNTDPNIISQGFNLVKLLGSTAGGGHHVITKRRLMMDYSLKSIYPFVPLITTTTSDSLYLKGESTSYPTALLDFDGNERSAIHLRNSDLNLLHLLLQQLKSTLKPEVQASAADLFFRTIDGNRDEWQRLINELNEELQVLHALIEKQRVVVAALPKKWTQEDLDTGRDQAAHREVAKLGVWTDIEKDYREYLPTLTNLLALRAGEFAPARIKIEDVIAKGAMGRQNTLYQLQNYVVGLSPRGLLLAADGSIDVDKSFLRINYFPLIRGATVRNNVQPGVSNEPVDFIGFRIPPADISDSYDENHIDEAVWLYKDEARQALILSRTDPVRGLMLKYVPVSGLKQSRDGKISFQRTEWRDGLPFGIWEDPKVRIPDDRELWLNNWHPEHEWLAATHRTDFSNSIIGVHEQFSRHTTPATDADEAGLAGDERLLRRFHRRRRRLVEPDLFVHASNHWNFDVRGFNPGGNHGSFYRVSTHSTLMFAGGENTGIPQGVQIDQPYDSLDLLPTLFELTGAASDGCPGLELFQRGFRQFAGRVIKELLQS